MAGGQETEGVGGFSDTAILPELEAGETNFDIGVSEGDNQERKLPPQVSVREVLHFWYLCYLLSDEQARVSQVLSKKCIPLLRPHFSSGLSREPEPV